MKVEVYYGRNDFMKAASLGSKWLAKLGRMPVLSRLSDTHEKVYEFEIDPIDFTLEGLFTDLHLNPDKISTDNFSTEDDCVYHQSMTIGDIVTYDGKVLMADFRGFKELTTD